MKSKRYATVVIAVLMLFVSLAAADPNSAKASTVSTSSVKVTQSATSSTVYGKVTKISGKKVTLALGTLSKPSKPDNSMKAKPSGTPKAAPSGIPKAKPSGAPKMPDNAGSPFKTNGKTKTIKVTAKTTIKARSKSGTVTSSFSNIKVNSILAVAYKNGNVSTITIQNPGK